MSLSALTGPALAAAGQSLAGWPEPLVIRAPLVSVVSTVTNPAFVGVTSGTATARIKIPSSKLITTFSLTFESNTQATIGSYNSSTWSATLIRPAYAGGREGALHSLFSAQTLPQGYQVEGLIGEVAVSAALTIPTVGGAGVTGVWALVCTFENSVVMCAEELHALQSRCGIAVARQLEFDAP